MNLPAAARAQAMPPFHAMAMARAAAELEVQGRHVLHLEVGQPATPAPAGAREAAARAVLQPQTLGYTTAPGLPALRARIARHYRQWYGVEVDARNVLVVGGASAGFVLAYLACFDTGARVGVLQPGYPPYRNALQALGMEPIAVPVDASTRWAPTPEVLDAVQRAHGRLDGLILASPSNPTGTVLGDPALAALTAYCATHAIRLVADEIYHGITFEGPAPTVLAHTRDAVLVNSFSKYFSMTGWRLGWMVVPDALLDVVERLQQNVYICAPAVSQVAGLAAFECQDELDGHVRRYAANRPVLLEGLARAGIGQVANADGAFYVYAEVTQIVASAQVPDSMALAELWLHELGVATSPGADFDLANGGDWIRLCYAGPNAVVAEAADRIAAWAHR
jgi:aspartate/methionine/tyrosine aminotransferase